MASNQNVNILSFFLVVVLLIADQFWLERYAQARTPNLLPKLAIVFTTLTVCHWRK